MAKTSRVTLDRQSEHQKKSSEPQSTPGATQAGVPDTESVRASRGNDKPTLDEIAEEAYAIYMGSGGQHGFDIDHWLEAERRIAARKRAAAKGPDVAADDPKDRS